MNAQKIKKPLGILALVAALACASFFFGAPPPRSASAQDVGSGEVDRTGYQAVSQFSASITAGTPANIISATATGKTLVLLDIDISVSSAGVEQFMNAATPDGTHTVGQLYCASNTPRNLSEKELGKAWQFDATKGVYLNPSVTATCTVTCRYKILN